MVGCGCGCGFGCGCAWCGVAVWPTENFLRLMVVEVVVVLASNGVVLLVR